MRCDARFTLHATSNCRLLTFRIRTYRPFCDELGTSRSPILNPCGDADAGLSPTGQTLSDAALGAKLWWWSPTPSTG